MTNAPVPPAEYYASLPQVIAGAGAIFHDERHRILLVKTTYTTGSWEIPGGGMDPGEYPLQTAQREIKEELGIDLPTAPLLAVDWVPPQPNGRPALVNFLFDGGRITHEWAQQHLRLASDELSTWRLADATEWAELMEPHMARRLDACAQLIAAGGGATAYLHHGWDPATTGR
jgi:8-oxo-dGTP pyrophosphatase MutT (NUDIX family)